jgi:glycerol-3-phosphate dehydrogenase
MNLVTRQILPDYAVGIHGQSTRPHPDGSTETRSQVLFVAPWRSYSLVGTLHAPFSGHPDHIAVSEHEIVDLLAMVNRAYRPAQLTLADVYRVQRGLLPAQPNAPNTADVRLVREGRVYDHRAESGIDGIITVVGVKYTTARAIAQKAVDLLFQKLRQVSPACQTHRDRLYGGQFDRFEDILIQFEQGARNQLPPEAWRPLLLSYGSEVRRVLDYVSRDRSWGRPVSSDTTVIRAEIIHAVRSEMARKLVDVTLRRTELGSARCPDETAFEECARIMAAELSWERGRIAKEIDEVWRRFESFGRVNDQIVPSLQPVG